MREVFKRRPSPALVISLVALIVAATGTASGINGKASSGVKGNSAVGFCNPSSNVFVDCVKLKMSLPHQGRVLLVAAGSWRGDANTADGQCHIIVGGVQVGLAPNPGQSVGAHADGIHEGSLAITGVTSPLNAGKHTFKLQCFENEADFAVDSAELSAVLLD
jgi:hypothetical protein